MVNKKSNTLPIGYRLHLYRIKAVLGMGGFGITYEAEHEVLHTRVAIKEYFPVEWSYRDRDDVNVLANTQGGLPTSEAGEEACYVWGLERFLYEARVLNQVSHPSVVRVKDFFEANGTAYIVMDCEEGEPLSQILQREKTLPEEQVRRLLGDVLPALEAVHAQGYLHRDLKPANLYRRSDGRTILIDFGAARQALGRRSKSVTSVFSMGYSPIEQYLVEGKGYGPWTDIYALGAFLYHCVTGVAPIEAPARVLDDPLKPAVEAAAGRYSRVLLRLIDRAMAVRPEKRFQSVAQMRVMLATSPDNDEGTANLELPIYPDSVQSAVKPNSELSQQRQSPPRKSWWRLDWLLVRIIQIINEARDHRKARPGTGKAQGAEVLGSGAIAQGNGAAAAGTGGVAIRGNVYGDVHVTATHLEQATESTLRASYLNRIVENCSYLSLTGIDPAVANQREAEARLSLDAVYTGLLTRAPRELAEEEDEKALQHSPDHNERLLSALEQLDRNPRLVLQGDPGSGKSTFVNFVALCLAGEALRDGKANLQHLTAPLPDGKGNDGEKRQPWRHGALLPVPVVLRDFAATGLPKDGAATAQHLWAFIEADLKAASLADYVSPLSKELRERGGLLLLDGLDEVPEAERRREQVKQSVEDFIKSFGKCRVLVTSRTYAYQNQGWRLAGFAEATLAPFSDGQIRRFVNGWYAHTAGFGRLNPQDAAGRAELLKRAIFARPALYELAKRPLLLTLMASLHAWRGGNLPDKREALYADTVDLLLNRWEQRLIQREAQGQYRLIQPSLAEYLKVDQTKVRGVLETLAFKAHQAQPDLIGTADIAEDTLVGCLLRLSANPDANPKLLVDYLRDRAGLLYPRGVGVYTFPHRNFQEYLAACRLTDDDYPEKLAQLTLAEPNRWREVALLAVAKAARGAAANLWQLVDELCCDEPGDTGIELAELLGAQITAQALIETADLSRLSPANQRKLTRVQRWLLKLLREERLPATERALAGDNLAVLGDPRFSPEYWYLPDQTLLGFLEIPAGPFTMGSDPQRDEQASHSELPQHRVDLPSYYLARWPVTVAQFTAFVQASGHEPADPDCFKGIANHPVVWVGWHEAMAYCHWLGKQLRPVAHQRLAIEEPLSEPERRFWQGLADGSLGIGLPSEAEWEKAARGTGGWIYPWGDQFDPRKANISRTALNATTTVGCFSGGASPYGCEEMAGNVWEWTRGLWGEDWRKPAFNYPYNPSNGREDLNVSDEIRRVLRGGAFRDSARNTRCAARGHGNRGSRGGIDGGFRVVASPFLSDR